VWCETDQKTKQWSFPWNLRSDHGILLHAHQSFGHVCILGFFCTTTFLKVDLFLFEGPISYTCCIFLAAHITAPTTPQFQILMRAGRMWAWHALVHIVYFWWVGCFMVANLEIGWDEVINCLGWLLVWFLGNFSCYAGSICILWCAEDQIFADI
jgi:hypothetical protein